MGLKKAFDDAEKRGEIRCSVCLSAVHSKEYHENAAQARLAAAPPEQAAPYHCTYCDGDHSEKDCPQRCVPAQPQVASGAALSGENIKLKIGSRFYDREPYSGAWDEPFNVACEVLNAALAAHDQKVRREVLEEAAHIAEVTWLNRVGPTNEKIKKVFMAIRSLASGSGGEGEVKCG